MKKILFIALFILISLPTVLTVSNTKIAADSYVDENGVPRCRSPYSEACGAGCNRQINCGSNGEFRPDPCICEAAGPQPSDTNNPNVTKPKTCPVATVYNPDTKKCDGTGKEGTPDRTEETDPVEGGSETVAPKVGKPNDPKTRQEANEVCDGPCPGQGGGSGSVGTTVGTTQSSESVQVDIAGFGLARNQEVSTSRLAKMCSEAGGIRFHIVTLGDSVVEGQCFNHEEQLISNIDLSGKVGEGSDYNVTLDGGFTVNPSRVKEGFIPLVKIEEGLKSVSVSGFVDQANLEMVCKNNDGQFSITTNTRARLVEFVCDGAAGFIFEVTGASLGGNSTEIKDPKFVYDPQNITNQELGIEEGQGSLLEKKTLLDSLMDLFAPKVSAQPVPETINPEELESGIYIIEVPGYKNAVIDVVGEKVKMKYFEDKNADGIKQDDETLLDIKVFEVKIALIASTTYYPMQLGWNLIALNGISVELNNASKLARDMRSQGIKAVQVSKYDDGNWVHFVLREKENGELQEFGNSFTLVPGEAYFVRAQSAGKYGYKSQVFTSAVPLLLSNGWNLTSIQTPNQKRAKDIVNQCREQGGGCTTISRLLNGTYDSVVFRSQSFFGNDFDIKNTEGYFILNDSNQVTITP